MKILLSTINHSRNVLSMKHGLDLDQHNLCYWEVSINIKSKLEYYQMIEFITIRENIRRQI